MDTNLFTIFDQAAGLYLEPFFAPSIEYAIREFRAAVNNDGHQFANFPGDFTLFHIGRFDPETGKVTGMNPASLGVALTFLDRIQLEDGGVG